MRVSIRESSRTLPSNEWVNSQRLTGLCIAIVTTVVFAQTTYSWTNRTAANSANFSDLGDTTHWKPNAIPHVTPGMALSRFVSPWA